MTPKRAMIETARRPRKCLWAVGPALALALLQVVPAGADPSPRPDGAKPAASGPTGVAPAAIGLPVAASQSGPWTVGVNSLPPVTGTVGVNSLPPVTGTVNLGNTAANPVPVQSIEAFPAEPFWANAQIINDSCVNCGGGLLYEVPAGKVAVIEVVSAYFSSPVGTIPEIILSAADSNQLFARSHVALDLQGNEAHPQERHAFAATHSIRLYAPAGSSIGASLHFRGSLGLREVFGSVEVNGYLLPAP